MAAHKPSQEHVSPAPVRYESVIPNPNLRLLDQIREVMRLKHYSIRTERTYCDWVRRHVQFHEMKSREAMLPAGAEAVGVKLADAIGRLRAVPPDGEMVRTARALGIGFGD